MGITRQNQTKQRATDLFPLEVWDRAVLENQSRIRPTPVSSLLDLHFPMRGTRKVNNDQTIDFEGRNHEIATTARESVTIIHQPSLKFWVVEHPPKDVWHTISGTFGL